MAVKDADAVAPSSWLGTEWSDVTVQVATAITLAMMGLVINFVLMLYTLKGPAILVVLLVIAVVNLLLRAKWGPLMVLVVIAVLQYRSENHRLVLVPHYDFLHPATLALVAAVIGYMSAHFQFLGAFERAAMGATRDSQGKVSDGGSSFRELAAPFAWILLLPVWPYLGMKMLRWVLHNPGARGESPVSDGISSLLYALWLLGGMTMIAWVLYWYWRQQWETPSRARMQLTETVYSELEGELKGIAKRSRAPRPSGPVVPFNRE